MSLTTALGRRPRPHRSLPRKPGFAQCSRQDESRNRASHPKSKLGSKKKKHRTLRTLVYSPSSSGSSRRDLGTSQGTFDGDTSLRGRIGVIQGPPLGRVSTTQEGTSWAGPPDIYRDHSPHAPRSSSISVSS